MSTTPISNSSPSFIQTLFNQVTSSTPTEETTSNPTQDSTPSYFGLNIAGLTVDRLGIFVPSNPEAIEAILAQASLELDKTVADTVNNRTIAHSGAFRTALSQFADIIGDMAAKQVQISTLQQQIDNDKAQVATKTQQRDAKVEENKGLQKKVDADNATISSLDTQIAGYNTQIATLNDSIKTVQAAGGDASALIQQRDGVQAQLNQATATRATTVADRDALVAKVNKNKDEINQLNKDIDNLNKDIETKTAQQKVVVAEFFLLQSIMLNVFVQAALSIQGAVADDLLLAVDYNSNVFRAFEDLASNINEFGDLLRQNIENQSVRDQVRDEDDTRARVIAAAAGLVLGVLDLLATLKALDAPPTVDQGQAPFVQGLRLHLAI